MKKTFVVIVILQFVLAVGLHGAGTHTVKGYTKKDGTYVAPHRQTNPDSSKLNNWSTKGNINPDTGKKGTKDPDKETAPKKN
jgi:hypothetical protein